MPSAPDVASIYSREYYQSYVEGAGIAGGNEEAASYLKSRLRQLTSRVGRGRIIDLGCGKGAFVAHARDQGWTAIGVETSSWAAEAGRRRYGVQIFDAALEDCPIPPGSIDVVHANHVLEHLPDPVSTMNVIYRLLRSGGLLVAEVPQELFTPLAEVILGRVRPKESHLPNYHLVFFSRPGLEIAAQRAGFEVERIDNLRHVETLKSRSFSASLLRLVYGAERMVRRASAFVLVAKKRP